jgi:Mrp family chromosome partitioning ATPase
MTPGTPNVPLTLPKGHSSDRGVPVSLPSARTGPPPNVHPTPMPDRGPTTERMFRPATPADPVAPIVAQGQQGPLQPQQTPTAALALRPWEPPRPVPPPPPEQLDRRLILVTEPHSARAASFRLLRDSLVSKSMPRVVAVTSAAPKEGKTTCAANLALALSEQPGTRVLLLDANWFAPELHEIFKIAKFPSIAPPTAASWLAPYKLIESRPTLHVGAFPLTPGEAPPRFDQQRFDAMIDRLVRVAYDYIIVDAPALKGSPAVVQLLGSADGTLVAVRTGGTTTRDLRRAVEQIPKAKALGIALVDA